MEREAVDRKSLNCVETVFGLDRAVFLTVQCPVYGSYAVFARGGAFRRIRIASITYGDPGNRFLRVAVGLEEEAVRLANHLAAQWNRVEALQYPLPGGLLGLFCEGRRLRQFT